MVGYDPNFLGVPVALPLYTDALGDDVLSRDALADGIYAEYPHYTVVTNRERRSPIFAALNIDQTQVRSVARTDDWKIDPRIGGEFQLNNDYYANNPWDRGHMARRASAAWGPNDNDALNASDETFYYSNATLQHQNFNRDEWVALEDWVLELNLDRDDKITSFSGPIFGDFERTIRPQGRRETTVPAAFFKVVSFINQAGALETRAFIAAQDPMALADMGGRSIFEAQNYQVTVTEIERRTGLIFPDDVRASNPLLFHENADARDNFNVVHVPERIEVGTSAEIIDATTRRRDFADADIDVYIAAALVNPQGADRGNEWISVINLSNEDVDLAGWSISDTRRFLRPLAGVLGPGQAQRIQPVAPLQLVNTGGVLVMFDDRERRVDRVSWRKEQGEVAGKPVVFAHRYVM